MINKSIIFLFLLQFGMITVCSAQKILALDKPGHEKRIRYKVTDLISLKTADGLNYYGEIILIKDSSIILESKEVFLKDIVSIQNTKKHEGWALLANISFKAGLGYFVLDSGNHLINGEADRIGNSNTVLVSSISMGVFVISSCIANRRYRINKNRRLKIIDVSI